MAAGDLITNDWEMELGGLLMGGDSLYGLVSVEGLLDLPGVNTGDRNRLRRHGTYPGDDFLVGRTVEVTVEVDGSGGTASLDLLVQALLNATRPGQAARPLHFRFPAVAASGKRFINGRVRERSMPVDLDFYYRLPVVKFQVYADDPRIYDATLSTSGAVGLPSGGGGLDFPALAPFVFGTASAGGNVLAVNAGTFETAPVVRLDGPLTNPRIQNVTTGQTLSINLTVDAGQWLDVDFDRRTVLLNGTASRYSSLASDSTWWTLAPGTTEVQFRATTLGAGTMTMTWRSAWV